MTGTRVIARAALMGAAVVLGTSMLAASAGAVTFCASGTDTDGHIAGCAAITLTSNSLSVVLTNTQNNPTSLGQLVSGFDIVLSTTPSSVSGLTQSGQLIDVASN